MSKQFKRILHESTRPIEGSKTEPKTFTNDETSRNSADFLDKLSHLIGFGSVFISSVFFIGNMFYSGSFSF